MTSARNRLSPNRATSPLRERLTLPSSSGIYIEHQLSSCLLYSKPPSVCSSPSSPSRHVLLPHPLDVLLPGRCLPAFLLPTARLSPRRTVQAPVLSPNRWLGRLDSSLPHPGQRHAHRYSPKLAICACCGRRKGSYPKHQPECARQHDRYDDVGLCCKSASR